ncbi:hypothetical protein ACP4OV_028771 [Aristida adscensionis]
MATKAASSGAAYEEQRRKRVLENLKQLEDLGISEMSKSLLQAARLQKNNKSATRASPKPRKKFDATEVRRSSRARTTVVSYKEDFGELDTFLRRKRRSGTGADQRREYTGRIASYGQQERAFRKAEKLQDSLDPENPSFVKTMGLPSGFCKKNLPSREFKMVLEDEDGVEFDAVYIGNRTGLSGGWRGFAMHHNLEDGDSLVFELAEPDRFKIYIIKAIDDNDGKDTEIDDKKAGGVRKAKNPTKDPDDEDSPVAEQSSPEPPKGAKRRKLRGRR